MAIDEKADAIGDHQEIKHGGTFVNLTHNGGAQNVGEILTTAATNSRYRVHGTCSRAYPLGRSFHDAATQDRLGRDRCTTGR